MGNFNSNLDPSCPSRQTRLIQPPSPTRDFISNNDFFAEYESPNLTSSQLETTQSLRRSSRKTDWKAPPFKIFRMELRKAFKIAMILIIPFLIISFAPLSKLAYEVYHDKSDASQIRGALEFMSANLKADPMMDLKRIDKDSACPDGFEALVLGIWPGTVAGCLGENGDLFDLPCERTTSVKNEKDIPRTPPLEIYELNSSIWCGKRAVLDQDYIKRAECPVGYRECYPGGCFLKECPLTKVEFTSEKGLILTRTQGELPVINIQVTSNDIPCFNPDFSAKSNSSYGLLDVEEREQIGCDKYGLDDKFTTQLSSQLLFDAYTQNVFRYSAAGLPHFDKYSKSTLSVLSFRVRMETAKAARCLNLNSTLIADSIWAFRMGYPSTIFVLIPFYLHAFSVVSLIFHFVIRITCKFHPLRPLPIFIFFALIFIGYMILGMSFLVSFPEYQLLKEMKQSFEEYDTLECFGEGQGSMVIKDHLEILKKGVMFFELHMEYLIPQTIIILTSVWFLIILFDPRSKYSYNANIHKIER